MSIRVAIVDDQKLVREGIKSLLSLSGLVSVVAEGDDGDALVDIARTAAPDVVLLDLQMPRMDGIAALGALSAEGMDVPVIILTTFDDHGLVLDGLKAGARGYLLKDVSLERLIDAIERVHAGETMVQPALTESLLSGLADWSTSDADPLGDIEALTRRETEVLRLMAGGYSNREISTALAKSEGTIKNHVSSILGKLGARDRTRAVLKALQSRLI